MNQASDKAKKIFSKEIKEGKNLRNEYMDQTGIDENEMQILEKHAPKMFESAHFFPDKGSTDNIGTAALPEKSTSLVNKPMYDALLEELKKKKDLQQLGGN